MLEAHSQMALISNTSVRNQTSAADTRPRTGQRVTWCECYLPARAITKLHCSVTRATKCDNLAYVTISPGVQTLTTTNASPTRYCYATTTNDNWPFTVILCSPVPGCVNKSTWIDASPTGSSPGAGFSDIDTANKQDNLLTYHKYITAACIHF